MKVRELIAELQKLDPEAMVVSIMGDCDEVCEAGSPVTGFVDQPDDPLTFSEVRTAHCTVPAVWV
jgi:hypothetical protein